MVNECLRHMLKYICSSPISLFDFLRLTFAKAKEMLKRTAVPGVSRLAGAYWVRWLAALFAPDQFHHRHIWHHGTFLSEQQSKMCCGKLLHSWRWVLSALPKHRPIPYCILQGFYFIYHILHIDNGQCIYSPYFTYWLLSTHWHCILLSLPYFTHWLHSTHWHFIYCISLFQASVALMFTDLNLVLLLYHYYSVVTLP